MTIHLAEKDAVIWDYDGVKYDEKAIPNLDPICDRSCSEAAVALLPELNLHDAHNLAQRSYQEYGDCLGAFVEWAIQNGRDPLEFRQALFELYHTTLFKYFLDEHAHIFDPNPATLAEFRKRAHIRHGVATHSYIDGYARPLLAQAHLIGFFNEEALIGMDMVGFARKSQSVASLELCLEHLGATADTALFVEDNLKNLACAKRLLPKLTTVFMHHGRPLDQKPSYVDFQFTNNCELMKALNSSAAPVVINLPPPRL